jgi:pimeloyl-ACP methyl ester carboxylesterase
MPTTAVLAVDAPNQFADINGRRLAYRSIGAGKPIVLCTRFRGTMDVWDPGFLDALAANGLRAIVFDYSGLGHSTGERTMNPLVMAQDARDLIEMLALKDVVIAGWSLGGMVAQVVLALYPQHLSHAVLIGTTPPGTHVKTAEQLFYDTASMPTYGLEEETILFFEPRSAASREAARRSVARIAQRQEGRSPPVPVDWAVANLGNKPKPAPFPADAVLQALERTTLPVLHIGGDHDIIFPVENWYALNPRLPTLQLLTFPRAGHGPQHEHPQACAEHIASFVRHTPPAAHAA